MTDQNETAHPVDELRTMIEASLEAIKDRVHRLSPGALDALAVRLARAAEGDALQHPVEVIQALSELTARRVLGRHVICSREIRLAIDAEPVSTMVYPETGIFLVAALRIQADLGAGGQQFDGDLTVKSPAGYLALERCAISEFSEMTPLEPGVISKEQPLVVTIYPKPGGWPLAHSCWVILRGEAQGACTRPWAD